MCLSKHLGLVSHCFPPFQFILRTNSRLCETGCCRCWLPLVGRLLGKSLEGGTRAPGDEEMMCVFLNSSWCDVVPLSVCPMHVLAVGRVPCTWRFGIHGIGTRKYYSKGVAFADSSSPCLSAPRVSSLRAHLTVGLDVVNPGCITAPERIL